MTFILVTGGAGYIGSLLIPRLLEEGYKVRVLDNLMYGQATLLPYFFDTRLEFIRGDVRDKVTVQKALKGVDAIIHLAAIVGAPACQKDPRLAEETNHDSTVLINQMRSPSQALLYASTGSNYGAVDGICTEDTPLKPLSVYGVTKTNAEKVVSDSPNYLVYRFATAFGLSPRLRLDLLINDFTFQAVRNKHLVLYEKGFRRTFIHVRDIARAYLHALANFERVKETVYNVGHESMNYTKEDVALAIKEQIDYHLYIAEVGSDPDKRDYEVSYDRIRATGFETSVTLEEGISELIRGYEMVSLKNPYSNVEG